MWTGDLSFWVWQVPATVRVREVSCICDHHRMTVENDGNRWRPRHMFGARAKRLAKFYFLYKRGANSTTLFLMVQCHESNWVRRYVTKSFSIGVLTLGCLGSVSSVTSRPSQLLRSLARARCVGPRPSASTCTRALPRFTRPPSAMRENVTIRYRTKTGKNSGNARMQRGFFEKSKKSPNEILCQWIRNPI